MPPSKRLIETAFPLKLMDNREGLVVDVRLTPADGSGERVAAVEMLASVSGTGRITLGPTGAMTNVVSSGNAGS